jgi:hypothetical protein
VISHYNFDLCFPDTNVIEYLTTCQQTIYVFIFSGKMSIQIHCLFLVGLSFHYLVVSSLYNLAKSALYLQDFAPFYGLSFGTFMMVSVEAQFFKIMMKS